MSRTRGWWLVGWGALVVAACTDPNSPARAAKVAFLVQPANATAGIAISPVIAVMIEDVSGNIVPSATNTVTVTIATNSGGATLAGAASVAAVNGVASFPSLHIDKAGAGYTLKATVTGLMEAISTPFSIVAAGATHLEFTVQPGNTMGGGIITPPVQVTARDAFGNLATGFQGVATVALGGNPAPGTLSGTTAVNAVNGVATFSNLVISQVSPGYTLTASAAGLAGVTSVPFAVTQPTASLRITTATTGSGFDPDGYVACVDSGSDGHGGTACAYGGPQAVGSNSAVTVTVDTGAHTVLLMGVAANCAVAADNPRAVHALRGETVGVPFAVACAQSTLHVTTTTTGVSLDPDGYSVCVDPGYYYYSYDCAAPRAIGLNGGVTLSVTPGAHVVELDDVADNCEVSGDNPRNVAAGGVIDVPFVITCFATGSVRVTTFTTGSDLDPNGYAVCVDRVGNSCYWNAQLRANDVVTIAHVIAGPHTVTFSGTTGNCTISGAMARAVTVPADGIADLTFNIACVQAERIAYSINGNLTVSQLDGSVNQTIAHGFAPAWSPNGTRLAYECDQDICAINADGSGFTRLTFDATGKRHPTWSPDGLRIAFAATHGGDLYVMAADGSGVVRLTQGVGALGSPAWGPDGARIVFDCSVDVGNDDICVVNADGSAFARLTTDPARDYGAAWKPDGSTLAFATTRYGADEIVLMSPAGGSVTRIGGGLPGFGPTWSPAGTQLAFAQLFQDYCYYGYGCSSYGVVVVARSDGSNVRTLAIGDQPAWRPHP